MPVLNPGDLKQQVCMTDGCAAPRYSSGRGLCMNCYSKAKAMVEAKKTTWEELESMEMVAPKASDKFTTAFNSKKKV